MAGPSRHPLAHRLARRLAPVVHHPATSLVTGLGMLACGVAELAADLVVGFDSALAAHHGLILFGLVMALRGTVDIALAVERLDQGLEQLDAAPPPCQGDRP